MFILQVSEITNIISSHFKVKNEPVLLVCITWEGRTKEKERERKPELGMHGNYSQSLLLRPNNHALTGV